MVGSARAYAKHRGVTQPAVIKAIKAGRLRDSISRTGRNWIIEFELADEEWKNNSNERRDILPADDNQVSTSDMTLNEARRLNEIQKLRLNELAVAKQRGDTIEVAEAKKTVFSIMRVLRDQFLAIPPRITGSVLAAKDEPTAILAVKEEIQRILDEASTTVENQFTSS